MKVKMRSFVLSFILLFLWLIPLYSAGGSFDNDYIKNIVVYGLFAAAAYLCYLLPNRHAALISSVVIGIGICVLRSAAAFDVLPSLFLCCWLRCYTEYEAGNKVTVYFELFTDLIYAYIIAAVIRLVSRGYAFPEITVKDMQAVPDICLMAFVLLLFIALFIFKKNNNVKPVKKQKQSRAERNIVGAAPVYISLRTFFGFFALLLAVCLLQYVNSKMIEESFLFLHSGFRLLFLPWMLLLFFIMDAFFPESAFRKRFLYR